MIPQKIHLANDRFEINKLNFVTTASQSVALVAFSKILLKK